MLNDPIVMFHVYAQFQIQYIQGRQSVPKSGRSERGGERNLEVTPMIVLGGAEKVVVHMHWLTWLLWRP